MRLCQRKLASCSRCDGTNRETDREIETDLACVGLVYLCEHTVIVINASASAQ